MEEIINVIIPMAGKGQRFKDAGYTISKPFIPVPFYESFDGETEEIPMIELAIKCFESSQNNMNKRLRFILIALRDQILENFDALQKIIKKYNVIIHPIDGVTEGSVCTILKAKGLINNDEELIISNCDQWFDWNIDYFFDYVERKKADGAILTFPAKKEKWSFVDIEEDTGLIKLVAEKRPISTNATVGVYYWRKGSDFVKYAEQMIKEDYRVNGEFYTCPVYNFALQDKKKIVPFPAYEMWGLGTPEDLDKFKKSMPHDRGDY